MSWCATASSYVLSPDKSNASAPTSRTPAPTVTPIGNAFDGDDAGTAVACRAVTAAGATLGGAAAGDATGATGAGSGVRAPRGIVTSTVCASRSTPIVSVSDQIWRAPIDAVSSYTPPSIGRARFH